MSTETQPVRRPSKPCARNRRAWKSGEGLPTKDELQAAADADRKAREAYRDKKLSEKMDLYAKSGQSLFQDLAPHLLATAQALPEWIP